MTDLADDAQLADLAAATGPMLHLRGQVSEGIALVVVLVRPAEVAPPPLNVATGPVGSTPLLMRHGVAIHQYALVLPMEAAAWYEIEGRRYTIDTRLGEDLRIAFVSCNGQEHGDRDRSPEERNVLWSRLAERHAKAPVNLILHGGDQIYADEILDVHPVTREWGEENGDPGNDAGAEITAIREALSRALLQRYLELYGQPQLAHMLAQVPSLAMWDDHDICDGWGSLPDRKLDSPVGRAVFEIARDYFLLFQLGGSPHALPSHLMDPTGAALGWHVALPDLHIVAPDLRSERRRRQIMGENGWQSLEQALKGVKGRTLLVSSVPALGPRLSLIETLMRMTPTMEKYEDDLRDQWQSRTHRSEWRRLLRLLLETHSRPGNRVTVVSGEIHLATRATLDDPSGPLHQLVASGITHPPPPELYARALGTLARLGETPLKGHPIRIHPLPGRDTIYTARRNFLMLARENGRWRSWWELEDPQGVTPPLDLD
ncbi:alkaline phosphatase D family protein [Pararhizobium haloflavum]|uniref:alkaline phosphatase D family protein n=1 Tax=Pararhizobium haloflavum TaxID=2037914 RepID=UPI0018E4C729|nr:alkaline phosphatase D family protein [Pararhizobium haloflavum]